jgi:hypothetical protein
VYLFVAEVGEADAPHKPVIHQLLHCLPDWTGRWSKAGLYATQKQNKARFVTQKQNKARFVTQKQNKARFVTCRWGGTALQQLSVDALPLACATLLFCINIRLGVILSDMPSNSKASLNRGKPLLP